MDTPKQLLTYDAALATALPFAPSLGVETVDFHAALGRVLREDVTADRDQPPFNRATMDGFAVRSGEVKTGASFVVAGTVAAGGALHEAPMPAGTVVRIATGAPLPADADAVVPVEQTIVEAACSNLGGGERVVIKSESARAGQNVHPRAADASAGAVVLKTGTRLSPHHLGIAAAVGATHLKVTVQPRVAVITSGDEVVPPATATAALGPQQIRNSNAPMLSALLTRLGCEVVGVTHAPDDPERTLAACREELSRSHLVVTAGGVSVGQRDLFPWAWQRLGLKTVLHGVSIQPGRPILIAAETEGDSPQSASHLVAGLPGNPVSVLCTFHLFVWPLIARMVGASAPAWRRVALTQPATSTSKRQLFRAATLDAAGAATLIPWHGSGDLIHTAAMDGWVRLPLSDAPVAAGGIVDFLPVIS